MILQDQSAMNAPADNHSQSADPPVLEEQPSQTVGVGHAAARLFGQQPLMDDTDQDSSEPDEDDPAQSSLDLDARAEAAHFNMLAHDLRGSLGVMLAEAREIALSLSKNGVIFDLTRMN